MRERKTRKGSVKESGLIVRGRLIYLMHVETHENRKTHVDIFSGALGLV